MHISCLCSSWRSADVLIVLINLHVIVGSNLNSRTVTYVVLD